MSVVDGAAASGEQRAQRARAKAAELRAEAERQERFAAAVEKGNAGEHHVAGLLDVLDGAGWVVLNDRYKDSTSRVNLDHVVVGPPGVFVIDSKKWSGRLRLDERGMAVNGYRRDKALADALELTGSVHARALSLHGPLTSCAVLAFVDDVGLPAPVWHQGVALLQAGDLLPWLTGRPAALSPQEVQRLGSSLDAALPPRTSSPRPLTTATLGRYRARSAAAGRGRAPAAPRTRPGARPLPPARRSGAVADLGRRVLLAVVLVVFVLPLLLGALVNELSSSLRDAPAPSAPTAPALP